MTRRLDLGIASFQNPERLATTIDLILANTVSDFRLLIVDNASPDPAVRTVIEAAAARDPRVIPRFRDTNIGYAGAVNEILQWAETDNIAYVDNDCSILTRGWDEILAAKLDGSHELAMAFSGKYCAYELQRRAYVETLWGVGCFWMLKRMAQMQVGLFDETLGHQEEVDFQLRLRLAGWRMACVKEVDIDHAGSASVSTSPVTQKRISDGVVAWMNKWVKYFAGEGMTYYSDTVLRYPDWPPCALYLEEWYLANGLTGLNDNPETVVVNGTEMDLIKVPRHKNLYRGRII